MVPEAPLHRTETGLVPEGDGWFVLNARDAPWKEGVFGAFTRFEGESRFPMLGINLSVLQPGQPSCMYHDEDDQEDFLVLVGECLVLIEEEERPLKAWDFVHCPPNTKHVFVGAGEGPCLILAVGSRTAGNDGGAYYASELALKHGAGVERDTPDPSEAYARFPKDTATPYREGWLPDF